MLANLNQRIIVGRMQSPIIPTPNPIHFLMPAIPIFPAPLCVTVANAVVTTPEPVVVEVWDTLRDWLAPVVTLPTVFVPALEDPDVAELDPACVSVVCSPVVAVFAVCVVVVCDAVVVSITVPVEGVKDAVEGTGEHVLHGSISKFALVLVPVRSSGGP
jgi:hypothetical protein